jgi:hypothetical protein
MSEMKVSRRKFLAGSAATAAGAAVATSGISLLSERAEAFFNMGAFWKKPAGNGQTSNGYAIGQSLRFNSANSAYLSRSCGITGPTFTLSTWVKRAKLGTLSPIFSLQDSSGSNQHQARICYNASDSIESAATYVGLGSVTTKFTSSGVYRDPSAWHHVVVSSSDSSLANGTTIYINGSSIGSFSNGYLLTTGGSMTAPWTLRLGYDFCSGAFGDLYLADVYLIDGQALDATYFGQTDTKSGQWIPKAYSGSYGTNGFNLAFKNSSLGSTTTTPNITNAGNGTSTWTLMDNTYTITNNQTVANIGVYSMVAASLKIKIVHLVSGSTYQLDYDQAVSHGGIGWQDFALTTPFTVPASGSYYVAVYTATNISTSLVGGNLGNSDFTSGTSTFGTGTTGAVARITRWSTANGLGTDSSENGNHFSTAGINSFDQVLDSPTNNFCTMDPLTMGSLSLSAGNLKVSVTSPWAGAWKANWALNTGKWYWEVDVASGAPATGIIDANTGYSNFTTDPSNSNIPGYLYQTTNIYGGGSAHGTNAVVTTASSAATAGDIIGFSLNCDANTLSITKNNIQVASFSTSSGFAWTPIFQDGGTTGVVANFNFGQGGQSGLTYDSASGGRFKFTPPAGFKALSTANLPAPAIKKPSQFFSSVLYTGTGATNNAVTGVGHAPDLVWIKSRTIAQNHRLFDKARGVTKALYSSLPDAEQTFADTLSAFDSDGFTVGFGDTGAGINQSGNNYVAWCWKKGATPGFDIVSYTGNNGAAMSVAHGLGTAPAFIVIKDRDYVYDWIVYHQALGATKDIRLNITNASDTNDYWDSTAPTASVFRVGTNPNVNYSTQRFIAYLWAEIAGFSKFGSYTGNGSTDGPFVYCGFKPAYVLVKRTDSATSWNVWDNKRNAYNLIDGNLLPDSSSAEITGAACDFLSNGFKLRLTGNPNVSGSTQIFAAFAEAPFKYANAR